MPRRPAYPRICIALGFETTGTLLHHARDEADNGGTFFEFRLDYLKSPAKGIEAIRTFRDEYPSCAVLATCRRRENRGRFKGSVEEQLRVLEAAAEAGACAVDLEIESAQPAKRKLGALREKADLIVSYHNFKNTPVMETVLKRLQRIPAAAYKIVTTAQKPSDIKRLLALAKSHSREPLIIMSMGEIGFPTRIITPIFGGLYTYAAPETSEGTAAGQVSTRQLRHLYHVDKLSRKSKIYGVIADPVGHSISPAVHNRGFQYCRIDAAYVPFLVEANRLKDFFETAEELPVTGFSVTIPHKQKVLRYLDIIDPLARRIGAVNTVWRKGGKWRGTNTDAAGVVGPLSRHVQLAKSSVLLAGNGGAARAAAFALSDQGAKLTITARKPERARQLANACGAEVLSLREAEQGHFDALVHATSVGMYPHVNDCLFGNRIPADVVFDLVYNPLETTLLRRAKEQKKTVIEGLQMFLDQAVRQFEIWTGSAAPRAAMEKAAKETLAASASHIIKK